MQGAFNTRRFFVVLTPVLSLFVVSIYWFARVQTIWIDETTQLSGASLTLGELLPWLTGATELSLGVPPDRMPPLSYFLDMFAWRIWGNNELAFRFYHAGIVAFGLVVLLHAVSRRYNLRVALFLGLFLVLSPKYTEIAVEIRAYPIFIALSCLQLGLLVQGNIATRPVRLCFFIFLGLISGYTHYFGVVATSAYIFAVISDAPDFKAVIRVAAAYLLLIFLWMGLGPFIFGAVSISSESQIASTSPMDVVEYFVQLVTSAPVLLNPIIALGYLISIAFLMAMGAIGLISIVRRERYAARHVPVIGLLLAITAGVSVTVVAAFVIKGFDALSPRYNIWMLPPIALFIALAADGTIGPVAKPFRLTRIAGVTILGISAIAAQLTFLKHADWFIHGPSRTLQALVAKAPQPTTVIYKGDGWSWGYFPLYYSNREALDQWLITPDGNEVIRITKGGNPYAAPQALSKMDGYQAVIVAQIDLKTYSDLRKIEADAESAAPTDLAPALTADGWKTNEIGTRPGNYSLTYQIYTKTAAAVAAESQLDMTK